MTKRLISTAALLAYGALLIKLMVFKDLPTIHVGSLMLNFGGVDAGHGPNLIPFKTILPYLFGYKGWIIAGINLVGNIALLIPVGILVPLVYRNITWKKSVCIGILSGLSIEILQVLLKVGIFDIDDVILNALGVVVGFGVYALFAAWIRKKQYTHIVVTVLACVIACAALYKTMIYPMTHREISPNIQSTDLCRGTNGTGEIVDKGNNTFTLKRNDGKLENIRIMDNTTIKNSSGTITQMDLQIHDRVTVVIDESETASAVFVCGIR